GRVAVARLARQQPEAEERRGGDRVSRRNGAVERRLGAIDERFVVARREEEAAALRVEEAIEKRVAQLARGREVAGIAGRSEEVEPCRGEEGVVVEVGVVLRDPVLPGAHEARARLREVAID